MTDPHELIYIDLLNARVCSAGTWDEALEWLRAMHPAGTTGNWSKKDWLPEAAPIACDNGDGRTHYMFSC